MSSSAINVNYSGYSLTILKSPKYSPKWDISNNFSKILIILLLLFLFTLTFPWSII